MSNFIQIIGFRDLYDRSGRASREVVLDDGTYGQRFEEAIHTGYKLLPTMRRFPYEGPAPYNSHIVF